MRLEYEIGGEPFERFSMKSGIFPNGFLVKLSVGKVFENLTILAAKSSLFDWDIKVIKFKLNGISKRFFAIKS